MQCPGCTREVEIGSYEWSAVECPWCGTVWIGGEEEPARILVPRPDEALTGAGAPER